MKTAFAALLLLLTALTAAAQVQPLTAWWIDTGDTDSTGLGNQIAPLGDINGDGLDDIVVAAAGVKKLYVYLGSTQPDTIPYMTIPCPDSRLQSFATGLFSVGDVNGDGYSDFIVQGTLHDVPPIQRLGYLYWGGPLLDTIPDLTFISQSPLQSLFASRGVGLGDINGDSYNDFAILDGGNVLSITPQIWGSIYIFYGGPTLDSIPDLTINADSTFNRIGWNIAPLGDVNADGFADFVMSAGECHGEQGEYNAGIVAIYYGGNPPDTLPAIVIHGPENSVLGNALAAIDWDGDGQKDIFAGTGVDYPPDYFSSLWEFRVSTNMSGQPDHIFLGQGGAGACIGHSMFGVDLNGDGRQDLVDGEYWFALLSGKVYLFLGGANADTIYDAYYYQWHTEAQLGVGACNAGDFNGDGIEDLAVGEPGYGNIYQNIYYGRLHIILGNDSLHQSGVYQILQPALPQTAVLLKAHPNPFNGQVVLEIMAPNLKSNDIQIYNVRGDLIRSFHLGVGQRRLVWDGKSTSGQDCSAGVYIAKLVGPNYQSITKLTLIK